MESYQYSAVERNNLMRLSQSIPFTQCPLEVRYIKCIVWRRVLPTPSQQHSSWAHKGLCAKIEFLSKEEIGRGLRRALKVLCTWSEYDILKPGHLYIVKSFLPEVVRLAEHLQGGHCTAALPQGNSTAESCSETNICIQPK
ncbi:transient receptor potential cation channel subfamily M member 7-like [Salvelinus sp. IW2-2015]|uniref:transient receptor potential cation channel subfamily M member 7-like n=1 Tax=Salvelinus sp. IW2-2015 TaxID=2691554 RepID=UPI0038D38519